MSKYPDRFAIDMITGRCNNHCQHCYSDIPFAYETLSYEAIVRLIDELNKSTLSEFVMAPWMLMHDPLLVNGLTKLLTFINNRFPKNSSKTLVSNLSVFSRKPDLMKVLKDMGINNYQFSFYGIGKTHDDFAGRKGAFNDIMKVLPLMKSLNIGFIPMIWLHSKIGPDLKDISKILIEYNMVPKGNPIPVNIPDPVGRQLINEENRPTYDCMIEYRGLVPDSVFNTIEGDICKNYIDGDTHVTSPETENTSSKEQQLVELMSYTVLPSGDVYPFWKPVHPLFKLGNLFTDGIDHIHEIYFGQQYTGVNMFESYDAKELVEKWGNRESRKLFQYAECVIEKYRRLEFFEQNPLK